MADIYSTTPLKSKHSEIRLLQLLPGLETSPIFGKLSLHNLDDEEKYDNHPYDALSYMWGTPSNAETINLNDDDNFKVTPNLSAALHDLRLPEEQRTIWIDAICINQNDLQERSDQVQLMRRIYQKAATVYVWLDVEVDPNNAALQKLLSFDDQSLVADLGTDASFWEPLGSIWKCAYWNRVWIQQEISNAARVIIQCRNVLLPIFNVYHFLRLATHQISTTDINTPIWIDWADVNPRITLPSRFAFLDSHNHSIQGSTLSDRDLNLLQLLTSSYRLECTDDRDRLYGILHLAHDYSEGDLKISYEHPAEEVYTKVAEFILRKYHSLSFLLYAGLNWKSPQQERILPTWVPDWRDPSTSIWISEGPKFVNEIPPFMSCFKSSISADLSILNSYGMRIDRITQIFGLPEHGELYKTPTPVFLETCKTIIQKARSNKNAAKERSDMGDEFNMPQWHTLASVLTAVDCFKREDADAHSTLKQAITMSADALIQISQVAQTMPERRPLTMLDVIRLDTQPGNNFDNGTMFARLAWGVIGKHLPFVGEKGGIGLVLQSAEPGDEVWVIFGCDKPMILRHLDDYFLVVGEGYYDGANRGEWMEDVPESTEEGDMVNGYKVESLKLR